VDAAAAEVRLRPVGATHALRHSAAQVAASAPPNPASAPASARWLAATSPTAYVPPLLLDELLGESLRQEADWCGARGAASTFGVRTR
jgi:hypothetical protein